MISLILFLFIIATAAQMTPIVCKNSTCNIVCGSGEGEYNCAGNIVYCGEETQKCKVICHEEGSCIGTKLYSRAKKTNMRCKDCKNSQINCGDVKPMGITNTTFTGEIERCTAKCFTEEACEGVTMLCKGRIIGRGCAIRTKNKRKKRTKHVRRLQEDDNEIDNIDEDTSISTSLSTSVSTSLDNSGLSTSDSSTSAESENTASRSPTIADTLSQDANNMLNGYDAEPSVFSLNSWSVPKLASLNILIIILIAVIVITPIVFFCIKMYKTKTATVEPQKVIVEDPDDDEENSKQGQTETDALNAV